MEKYKISDKKLVTSYRNGNEEAFAELLNRHQSRIFSTIYLIVKDRYVAEDLLQETCIKAVKTIRAGRYNEEGKFLPWIVRIAHNLAIDHFRKTKRHPEIVLEDGSFVFNNMNFSEDSYESVRIKKETHSRLRDFIKDLPENQREVLVMRHYMDMSFKEIADTTGVSINTALGRMRYALMNLRKQMDKYQNAYDQNFYPE